MGKPAKTPSALRSLPKVDLLLKAEEMQPLIAACSRAEVLDAARTVLAEMRREPTPPTDDALGLAALRDRIAAALARRAQPYYRRVVNGTGVILHTGLGRAVLAPQAAAALAELAQHPQRLELDLDTGQRGGRDEGCARLLRELTGCEDATVVNNNAAATLLLLAAVARGKGVVLSRGELVEIGGSFRIPDVMSESGARLVEVGTTNRTHLSDYRAALNETIGAIGTIGMLLKVHTSNYRIQGFTAEVEIEDLVALGREHGIPVAHDLGSGCAIDLARHGLTGEPLVRRSIAAGADLVCFSGDKLLGGPQAGILIGRREAIETCRRHPLFRALRPGRLIYTALEATLRLYATGKEAVDRLPVLRQLTEPLEALRRRASRLVESLSAASDRATVYLSDCRSQAGSGALPTVEIPSWGARVVPNSPRVPLPIAPALRSAQHLAAALRAGDPAILGRIVDDGVLFDVRTMSDEDVDLVAARVRVLAAEKAAW
ncbi:MAG TPA: L-seryl-tRNA(Sec) selenium transferase [Thermoanaerobaculia bacterium]|jgi:L-seryl-tRNA(Ser) seleniumtransferase|nr:L-seryl-tRNA(Sec) selenium transferase [Thermoanaerobaculia bacterium]